MTGASNGWAVAGNLTKSGKPLVASDPHLNHMLPSLFYQQHLHLPDLNVIGVTVAGLPYVLIGRNDHVAWAMTSAVADVIDLYVEKTNPDNPNQVLTPNGYQDISSKSRSFRFGTVTNWKVGNSPSAGTRHGPVLNDMHPTLFPQGAPLVSLQWNMEGASRGILALAQANRANTVQELRETMLGITVPSSMYLRRTIAGRSLFSPAASSPSAKNTGAPSPFRVGLRSTTGAAWWTRRKTPTVSKRKVFYAHGNNLMIRPDHNDIFIQIDSAPSYRMDRIAELLREGDKHDMASMAKIQPT